jgi:hypothetical protein
MNEHLRCLMCKEGWPPDEAFNHFAVELQLMGISI